MSKHNGVVVVLLILIAYVAIVLFKIDFPRTGILFSFLWIFTFFQFERNKSKKIEIIKTGIVYENIRCKSRSNGEWRIIIKNCQTQTKSLILRNKPLPRGLFFKNQLGDLVSLKVTSIIVNIVK